MSLILRLGLGIKKINIAIGKRNFQTIEEMENSHRKIKIKKTNSYFVNNNWAINQYKFCHYDKNGNLRSYMQGNPQGKNNFYIQEIKIMNYSLTTTAQPMKVFYEKAKKRIIKFLNLKEKEKEKISFERNLFFVWEKTKEYLKSKGIEKLLTQVEFELVDFAEIEFKLGWRDVDKKRKIEQYRGNIDQRKDHYTLLERSTGTLYLEYPLNSKDL